MEDTDLISRGYIPIRVLRSTSTSRVIVAESNSKQVVVKFVPEACTFGDSSERPMISSVSHEARILSSLDHRNIIKFIDHTTIGVRAVLVLEYASSGTLGEYIRNSRRLRNEMARKLAGKIAGTISYLHNVAGIAHCDIKSENILLDGEFEPKLADFGLAECVRRGSTMRVFRWKGSPSFAPPEAIRGVSRDPTSGDVWSFGVVVFHMVTGYLPFGTNSVQDTLQKVDQSLRWPRPLYSVDRECRKFIEMALHRNESSRPTIRRMLRHKWLLSSLQADWHEECRV